MAAMGVHERKSDTIVSPTPANGRRRFRRTRSEGYADDIKRQQQQAGTSSNSKWLVDYSSKQADLSPNSLLRLQALVEGEGKQSSTTTTQEKTPNIKLEQLQLQLDTADDVASTFEDNSVSSHPGQDTSSGLPQHKLLSPESPQRQQQQGVNSSSSSVCNNSNHSLAGDSEHSINLEKVFESQQTAATKAEKAQQALYCISVTISDQNEKIKFSLRNPEVLRALRKALAENGGTQPEQEQDNDDDDEDDDDSSSEEKQQSAPTSTQQQQQQQRSSIKKREIKCVIPHDRFQLPQMQVFRQPEQQRTSNASSSTSATGAVATTHHNLKLHCIDEANESEMMAPSEESEISMAASSMQSSCCDSFAGDSLKDDNDSTTSSQPGNHIIKVFQESTTDSSLKIEKVSKKEEESEEEEQHSLMQHRYLEQLRDEQPQQQQPESKVHPEPQEEEEVQKETQKEEEVEEEDDSEEEQHSPMQLRYLQQLTDQPQPAELTAHKKVQEEQEEEEEESDSEERQSLMQVRYLQQLKDQPQPGRSKVHQRPQEDVEEEESDDESVRNSIIGLYVTDESLRHSIAESTLAPSVVDELEADDLTITADEAGDDEFEPDAGDDDDDDETVTEVGYGVGIAYGVPLNHRHHHNNNEEAALAAYGASLSEVGYEDDDSQTECNFGDSISQIGNSGTTIGDSQTEAGNDYADSQSMVVYESEVDRAYDGDDTEVALEDDGDIIADAATTTLGAGTNQGEEEEEESADEYEEDMEEETYLPQIIVSAENEEEDETEGEIRDEADQMESKAACPVPESDAESERDAAETDGEESQVTNGTDESSQNNNVMRGLSVYLSAHSRKGPSSHGGGGGSRSRKKSSSNSVMKNCHDSQTVTSVTASMTTGGLDASNMTNNTNNTGSTGLTLKSHSTNRTSRSDPLDLLRNENSLRSFRTSKSNELDDCNRSMRLEDLSKNSRGSSAPSDDSYSRGSGPSSDDSFSRRRRGGRRPLSRMLAGDSQVSHDASKSSFFNATESDADDNSTVNSSVDHRRRRPRGQRRGSLLLPSASGGIIPRSNTPQGALLRTRSGDSISSSARSRASVKGDARPLLPPRQISRDGSRSNVNEDSRRRAPRRSKSMIDSSSGTNGMVGRSRGVNRTKSRESFMGGSRIKKWDGSAANRSGHGLSLLERHLDSGGNSTTKQRRHSRRRASISISKANSSIASGLSVPSLIQSLPKEV